MAVDDVLSSIVKPNFFFQLSCLAFSTKSCGKASWPCKSPEGQKSKLSGCSDVLHYSLILANIKNR